MNTHATTAESTVERLSGQPLLRVEGLVKSFTAGRRNHSTVLKGVSFEIGRGETLGLVGESGSGKSTTGRCIVRLTEPSAGRVVFNGVDLARLSTRTMRQQRRNLQMVFQDPASSLDSRMTIAQSVEEPLAIHRVGDSDTIRRRALETLERVGLDQRLASSKPHMLSGGQQQRAAIARAIVTRPELIILDEPVSALDVSVRAQVLNLLKELQHELGLSYLFIVHDLAIAEYFSDRVAVMQAGRIVEIGSSRALFREPSHPYTRALLAAIPIPDPRVITVDSDLTEDGAQDQLVVEAGCGYAHRCALRSGRSICLEQTPPLVQFIEDHWSACHFVDERAAPQLLEAGFVRREES